MGKGHHVVDLANAKSNLGGYGAMGKGGKGACPTLGPRWWGLRMRKGTRGAKEGCWCRLGWAREGEG
ncbi:hypothetical protein PIB30_083861, partial [Stylosanthes scabra]|nr:hypothetical protein [Stylosanthes scabra]